MTSRPLASRLECVYTGREVTTMPNTHGGKRIGAGRKSRAGQPTKAHPIRLTDEEWARLQEKARLAGLSVAEYIRRVAL